MAKSLPPIEKLWKELNINPNDAQRKAILHGDGPLFITAGPGCGKTTVLKWRALNLIVYKGIKPEEIFLGTFTEKAARQLQLGLSSLLGVVSNYTGKHYDLAKMYVGTIHSSCRKLLGDRRFSADGSRSAMPIFLDELSQYFFVYNSRFWNQLLGIIGLDSKEAHELINKELDSGWYTSKSKHTAVANCIGFFNRLSEECVDPREAKKKLLKTKGKSGAITLLIDLYSFYLESLKTSSTIEQVDFSILQQKALELIVNNENSGNIFKYIIIDEYQDTNYVQEQIFFNLARINKNICVVGDDDQSLYRFRGATVENFVDFKDRCQAYLRLNPEEINLKENYRSRTPIVEYYKKFVLTIDWKKERPARGHFRVMDKELIAKRKEPGPAVIISKPGKPDNVFAEIAQLVKEIIDNKKVDDPNQIAFLFPSLKSVQTNKAKQELEKLGLNVYAPRAGRFVEVQESYEILGLFLLIFGDPPRFDEVYGDLKEFYQWQEEAKEAAGSLIKKDGFLKQYIEDKKDEIKTIIADYQKLVKIIDKHKWDINSIYDNNNMKRVLSQVPGLSEKAVKSITNRRFSELVEKRKTDGRPYTLKYIVTRATSLDWNLLDLFYQLSGFDHFRKLYDLAAKGKDEGPICNLGLLSQYLSRFMEEFTPMITGQSLHESKFHNMFLNSYIYALYKRGESEYEDAEDPFPRGRIPFLTIHQSKGLEFPVVIMANPRKNAGGPRKNEILIRKLIDRQGEPLDKISQFDLMRMFYVALSRAKNLLIIPYFSSQGNWMNKEFQELVDECCSTIEEFDVNTMPDASYETDDIGSVYSYTGDFVTYKKCPRSYMIYRKYGFAPSRVQTMFFGSLIHRTIEDLHYHLIFEREKKKNG